MKSESRERCHTTNTHTHTHTERRDVRQPDMQSKKRKLQNSYAEKKNVNYEENSKDSDKENSGIPRPLDPN